MKKFAKIIIALVIFGCAFAFSGCGDSFEEILAPKDMWCEKVFDYTTDDDITKVRCYFYYASKTTTVKIGNKNTTLEPGLTVAAVPVGSEGTLFSILGSDKVALKTFKEGSKYNAEGEEVSSGKFAMNYALWAGICVFNSDILQTKTSKIPSYVEDRKVFDGTFDWSKITKKFLINKLVE